MKRIKIEEKNTKEFKAVINEIIKRKGHVINLNTRCGGKALKNGLAWNFDSSKGIKGSEGEKDGVICRYLDLNDKNEKRVMYSDFMCFKRSNLIDDILL